MIQGNQLHLIEIRNFPQLFRDMDFKIAVPALQPVSWDLNVFAVIDGEVMAISAARPQGRNAQHISNEFKPVAIPSKDHGARTGKARLLFIGELLADRLMRFVLY